jgi:hypothetical protein
MGRQITLYLDEGTWNALEQLQFGESRSDKIRYCIRTADETHAAHFEALLRKCASYEKFMKAFPKTDEKFWNFTFGDGA